MALTLVQVWNSKAKTRANLLRLIDMELSAWTEAYKNGTKTHYKYHFNFIPHFFLYNKNSARKVDFLLL